MNKATPSRVALRYAAASSNPLALQPDYGQGGAAVPDGRVPSCQQGFHPCQHGLPCECGGGCGCSGKSEDDLHPEGENYMSVQALAAMQEHAAELLEKVDAHTRLPDWVEAKLTEANSKLTDVYEYMAHGHGKTL